LDDILLTMDEEIPQCKCTPGGKTYVNEDGMSICVLCGGWIGSST